MFGYVKVFQPELKMREYEQYKAVYCSLCHALGKRYGVMARMTLSYDFTFLALFLMAQADEKTTFCRGRCPFHPLKKRTLCSSSPMIDFAADVAMLLTYHKLSDTVQDERFFKRVTASIARLWLSRSYRRAVEHCPEQAGYADEYMRAQQAVEREEAPSVDACAEPTAVFLSKLASALATDEYRDTTSRFGYCLGRFIYLADAADDLQKDLQNGRFNPFIINSEAQTPWGDKTINEVKKYAARALHASVAVCAECYDELPIKRFDGILRNVVYSGMPFVIRRICSGKQEELDYERSV